VALSEEIQTVIVSAAHRFVFIHNPKAAGTAFRTAIAPYHDHPTEFWGIVQNAFFNGPVDLAHLRSWELPIVAPRVFAALDSYTSLAFLRDPLPRFLSACAEHFRNFRPQARFAIRPPYGQQLLIHRLIRSGDIPSRVRCDPEFVHFSPQIWFTHLGELRLVRHLLPIASEQDNFSAAFALLGLPPAPPQAENRTPGANWRTVASPEIEAFVRDFYAQDYQLLETLPRAA
jgi:hypothetical protein